MILLYSLIITLIITASVRFSVHSLLQNVILFFHQSCLNRLPEQSIALPELQALVCGKNFSNPQAAELYISTGLIHLFVVSGAHLILLEKILQKSFLKIKKISYFFILIILFIYCLACELNPPIARSFISLVISSYLIRRHVRWPMSFRLLIVGLITLVLNPAWANSVSLQLSWIAGLVAAINSTYFTKHTAFFRQSLFFLLLWPMLIYLSVPSNLTILTNLILAPLLEFVLFPLSLLTWFFPKIHFVFDLFIEYLNVLLSALEIKKISQKSLSFSTLSNWGWVFIFLLHFYLHLFEINYKKNNYV